MNMKRLVAVQDDAAISSLYATQQHCKSSMSYSSSAIAAATTTDAINAASSYNSAPPSIINESNSSNSIRRQRFDSSATVATSLSAVMAEGGECNNNPEDDVDDDDYQDDKDYNNNSNTNNNDVDTRRIIFVGKSYHDDDDDDDAPPPARHSLPPLTGNNNILKLSSRNSNKQNSSHTTNAATVATAADPTITQFASLLRTKHIPPLDVTQVDGDGNCLFRAVSLQVYGDATMHTTVRCQCLDFMEREVEHYRDFVITTNDNDIDNVDDDDEETNKYTSSIITTTKNQLYFDYCTRKRQDGVHGNHAEIQAMSELYNRSIEVYVPSNGITPLNIFQSGYVRGGTSLEDGCDAPIRLCYTDGNHYDAVIDPMLPTAGLGLGLPGLQPGLADRMQLDEAKRVSTETALEEKMRIAFEESKRSMKEREEREIQEAIRASAFDFGGGGGSNSGSSSSNSRRMGMGMMKGSSSSSDDEVNDIYKKKALYLSEMDDADFDLEQAVLASSLESYQRTELECSSKPPSHGRNNRFSATNSSPRSLRSSSNSVRNHVYLIIIIIIICCLLSLFILSPRLQFDVSCLESLTILLCPTSSHTHIHQNSPSTEQVVVVVTTHPLLLMALFHPLLWQEDCCQRRHPPIINSMRHYRQPQPLLMQVMVVEWRHLLLLRLQVVGPLLDHHQLIALPLLQLLTLQPPQLTSIQIRSRN